MWKIFNFLKKKEKEEEILSEESCKNMSLEERGEKVFLICKSYWGFNYNCEAEYLVNVIYQILVNFPKEDKEEIILFIYNKLAKEKEERLKIREEKGDLIMKLKSLEN